MGECYFDPSYGTESFHTQLDWERASLARGNSNATTGKLDAFINQVEAKVRANKLDPVQATALITLANRVNGGAAVAYQFHAHPL